MRLPHPGLALKLIVAGLILISANLLTALPALAMDTSAMGGAPAEAPPHTEQFTPVDLPVTRAQLFSSGVGYFEHDGQIEGDAVLRLRFKTSQINDVLKSLVVMDDGGGAVSSVTYPSNDPLDRALKSFSVDLSGAPTLPDILRQLRGSAATVATPDKITGTILGVDEQTMVVGQPPAQVTEYRLNLVTDAGIRSIPLNTISTLTLDDPRLQDDLNKALALLTSSRDTDSKPVEIRFTGQGKRHVRVGYLVESPVWKTSYRLDLTGKPLLQGWAIVENPSETDWTNVDMSLISGRPISFAMDLDTPLYMPRPEVRPQTWSSLTPQAYDEGIERDLNEPGAAGNQPISAAMAEAAAAPSKVMDQMRRQPWRKAAGYSVAGPLDAKTFMLKDREEMERIDLQTAQVQAAGAALGELFTYNLANPVDMPRRTSAMLPIINHAISAEKVSIYNQSVLPDHPLNGVWVTNDTGLKMLGGPITVLDDGAYAGDAMIDYLAPGDRRLLSYAIDLAVTVDPSLKTTQSLTRVSIVRGIMRVTRMNQLAQTYLIKNKADVQRKIIVEHPFINGRELVDPKQYEEKTAGVYRFAVTVGAKETERFVVQEQQPLTETFAIADYAPDALVWYLRAQHISKSVKDVLAKAINLKRELADAQAQDQTLQQQLNDLDQEEDRIRRNIDATGRDSTSGQHFVEDLRQHEDQITQLKKEQVEVRKQIEAKRNELADYLEGLSVE